MERNPVLAMKLAHVRKELDRPLNTAELNLCNLDKEFPVLSSQLPVPSMVFDHSMF